MFDRVAYSWIPMLLVVICALILLPRTAPPMIRFVVDLLYRF